MRQGKAAIFGLRLDLRQREKLCADICNWLASRDRYANGPCFRQQSLNALKLPQARGDARLFRALENADSLNADGMGIVWTARLLGIKVPERVTGIDVMTALLPRFEKQGVRVFLLGARPDVVRELRARLMRRYPDLQIAGIHHGFDPDDAKLAAIVRQSGADAVFVALPSPRKEIFVDRFGEQTGCGFIMGVGGAFDVLSGQIGRAPVVMQKAGLEFLWRIACQPRYMLPRYGRGLWAFARLVMPKIIAHRVGHMPGWVRLAAMITLATPVILFARDGGSQVITPAADAPPAVPTDARPGIETPDMRTQIAEKISALSTPQDVRDMIDRLLDLALFGETAEMTDQVDARQTDYRQIDWQSADATISAVLKMMEVILSAAGGNSFLVEAVFGGVLKQLFGLHPEPSRLTRMIENDVPTLASRFFGDGAVRFVPGDDSFDDDIAVVETGISTPSSGITVPPAQVRQAVSYDVIYRVVQTGGQASPVWQDLVDELGDATFQQEDVSPR